MLKKLIGANQVTEKFPSLYGNQSFALCSKRHAKQCGCQYPEEQWTSSPIDLTRLFTKNPHCRVICCAFVRHSNRNCRNVIMLEKYELEVDGSTVSRASATRGNWERDESFLHSTSVNKFREANLNQRALMHDPSNTAKQKISAHRNSVCGLERMRIAQDQKQRCRLTCACRYGTLFYTFIIRTTIFFLHGDFLCK